MAIKLNNNKDIAIHLSPLVKTTKQNSYNFLIINLIGCMLSRCRVLVVVVALHFFCLCFISILDDMRANNSNSLYIANVNKHGLRVRMREKNIVYEKTCKIRDPNLINGI